VGIPADAAFVRAVLPPRFVGVRRIDSGKENGDRIPRGWSAQRRCIVRCRRVRSARRIHASAVPAIVMRVLMMLDWNRGSGGAEIYASALYDGLREAGDEVRLLTSNVGTAGDGRADYVTFGTESKAAQIFLQVVNPFAVATVLRILRDFPPERGLDQHVRTSSLTRGIAGAGRSAKGIDGLGLQVLCPMGSKLMPDGSQCTVQSGWMCCSEGCVSLPHWLRDQPRYALIRSAVRGVTRVIACSSWVRGLLAEEQIHAEVSLVPSPSPGLNFQRRPSPEPKFLFAGRLEREKGVDLLLRAFARLHQERTAARICIAGRGNQQERLKTLASDLGLEQAVHFPGWLSLEQLEDHFVEAWASVVPSLWAEPQGLVAVEAILRGVPVLASSAGGLAEVIDHGRSGLLFPAGDENALLECLQAVASGAAFPNHVLPAEVVRDVAERFRFSRHIHRMREIFKEIAGQPAS
jgi:hypothetical protein